LCKSPEEFKAWSQNLGHEKVLTTFVSYGAVASNRQGEILLGLANPKQVEQQDADKIEEVLNKLVSLEVAIRSKKFVSND
jgi:hypothetical protein